MNTPPAPNDKQAAPGGEVPYVGDGLLWHCVLAMLVPLWTPVANTAPVTSFNFDEAFKALQALQGRSMSKAGVLDARSLVQAQAHRMAVEDQRTKARLAAKEEAQRMREKERVRQAQKEAEDIGDFGL